MYKGKKEKKVMEYIITKAILVQTNRKIEITHQTRVIMLRYTWWKIGIKKPKDIFSSHAGACTKLKFASLNINCSLKRVLMSPANPERLHLSTHLRKDARFVADLHASSTPPTEAICVCLLLLAVFILKPTGDGPRT
jgi:hypothetical protein